MAGLFLSLRWAHVVAGGMALILFWIPVIAPKGGRAHVRVGWIYVFCMSVVVVTAFVMSALAFSVPLAIRQLTRPLSAAELSHFVSEQRVSATFLAYLAGVTLALGWQGIWAVETRRATKNLNMAFGLILNLAIVLGGLIVFVLGIKFRSGPLIGLSPLGPLLGGRNLRYLLSGPRSSMHWWYMHLGSMVGTGIAAPPCTPVVAAPPPPRPLSPTKPLLQPESPGLKRRQGPDIAAPTISSYQEQQIVPKRARSAQSPVKILPAEYVFCPVEDMVVLIANMISELIQTNDALPLRSGVLTRFHSR